MTPFEALQPLIDEIHQKTALKIAPIMQQIECGYRHVEPPIAAQDKARRKLRDLKIEERELEELLQTNRALQAQYEALIIPF